MFPTQVGRILLLPRHLPGAGVTSKKRHTWLMMHPRILSPNSRAFPIHLARKAERSGNVGSRIAVGLFTRPTSCGGRDFCCTPSGSSYTVAGGGGGGSGSAKSSGGAAWTIKIVTNFAEGEDGVIARQAILNVAKERIHRILKI